MKIISEKRGEGKTQQMIKWMLEAPVHELRVLVSANRQLSMIVRNEYCVKHSRLIPKQFMCVEDVVTPGKFNTAWLKGTGLTIVFGFDDIDTMFTSNQNCCLG